MLMNLSSRLTPHICELYNEIFLASNPPRLIHQLTLSHHISNKPITMLDFDDINIKFGKRGSYATLLWSWHVGLYLLCYIRNNFVNSLTKSTTHINRTYGGHLSYKLFGMGQELVRVFSQVIFVNSINEKQLFRTKKRCTYSELSINLLSNSNISIT